MLFNRKKFFDGFREHIDVRLTQARVAALEELLALIEHDRFVKNTDVAAFFLATSMIETAYTWRPIHEYGGRAYFIRRYGSQTAVGKRLGNDTPEEGADYAGRGFPQTTGKSNYERLEDALRKFYPEVVAEFERRTGRVFDLTVGDQANDKKDPDNMLDPAIAYVSMSYGSRTGLFTGKKVGDYNLRTPSGRLNSRRVINGTDRNKEIAELIRLFIIILDDAVESKTNFAEFVPPPPPETSGQNVQSQSDEVPPEGNGNSDPAANKDNIVIETPEKVTLWNYIKLKFAALTGTNIGFEVISNWLQQWEALGLTGQIRTVLTGIVIAASIIAIIIWVISWWRTERSKDKKVELATTANTTSTNLVHYAPTRELQDWKDWGAAVVRTTETKPM